MYVDVWVCICMHMCGVGGDREMDTRYCSCSGSRQQ